MAVLVVSTKNGTLARRANKARLRAVGRADGGGAQAFKGRM